MQTYEWLCSSVRTDMDLEVCLLVEALVAVGHMALVSLLGFSADLDFLFQLYWSVIATREPCLGAYLVYWLLDRTRLLGLDSLHEGVDVGSKVDVARF